MSSTDRGNPKRTPLFNGCLASAAAFLVGVLFLTLFGDTTSPEADGAALVPVIVVLAEKEATLEDVLNFAEGGIIAFKKHNSEPLNLLVNNQRIGSGKTIKVGERFGLHVREIGPPRETLRKLVSG